MMRYAIGLAVFLCVGLLGRRSRPSRGRRPPRSRLRARRAGRRQDVVIGAEIEFLDASGAVVARTKSGAGGYYRVAPPARNVQLQGDAPGASGRGRETWHSPGADRGLVGVRLRPTPGRTRPRSRREAPGGRRRRAAGRSDDPRRRRHARRDRARAVSDETLVGIAGALVQLARATATTTRRSLAAAQGGYEIVLTTGTWHATAFAPGYEPLVDADPIEITQGRRTNRDFLLRSSSAPGGAGGPGHPGHDPPADRSRRVGPTTPTPDDRHPAPHAQGDARRGLRRGCAGGVSVRSGRRYVRGRGLGDRLRDRTERSARCPRRTDHARRSHPAVRRGGVRGDRADARPVPVPTPVPVPRPRARLRPGTWSSPSRCPRTTTSSDAVRSPARACASRRATEDGTRVGQGRHRRTRRGPFPRPGGRARTSRPCTRRRVATRRRA